MLFLPSPKRLLLGYLVGALLTSLTIGFLVAERTVVEVQRFRAWLIRSGRRIAIVVAAALGTLPVGRGLIGYVA